MVAAIVAACFLILPGYTIAAFTKRAGSPRLNLVDAIVWSMFLCSAVFWFWPLHAFGLDTWFFLCLGLSIVGAVFAARSGVLLLLRLKIAWPKAERLPLIVAITAAGSFVLVNLIVHPAIDWDAVNYYLFVAIGFTNANHVGMTLPNSIIITPNTPNGITPLMPTLYALAIEAAAFFKTSADAAVHLIPFVFFVGTVAATRQLAARFMTSVAADAAALFIAIMPGMINYYFGNPLYVDGATVFVLTALANELYRLHGDSLQGPRIGALLTLLILSKANGFVLIGFVAVAVLAGWLGRIGGRVLTGAFAIALIALAALLHEYQAVSSIGLWIAIPLVAAACVVYVTPMHIRLKAERRDLLWAALFTVPGAFYVYALSKAAGSPAGFFAPSLIHVSTPNYHWALHALSLGALYSAAAQPGLPANYAAGLLLWWGFSPFINVLAIIGAIIAFRQLPRVRPIVLLVLFFYLGWLTIFNLTSFRHLLPVLPFLAVLAAFGLSRLLRERAQSIEWAALAVCLLSLPFAWTAQVGMYLPPMAWLYALSLDPYHALSGQALLWTALFLVCACGGLFMAYRVRALAARAQTWLESAAFVCFAAGAAFALYTDTIAAIVLCVSGLVLAGIAAARRFQLFDARGIRYVAVIAALLAIAAIFEPLIAAAISPGFAAQSASITANEDYGYVPALQNAMALTSGTGSILTYQGYGVTWFSAGRYRRVDLTDAFDLGELRGELQDTSVRPFIDKLEALGVRSAILPAPDSRRPYKSYRRMMERADLPALHALDDPMLAPIVFANDAWTVHRILSPTNAAAAGAAVHVVQSGGTATAIAIDLPRALQSGGSIEIHGSAVDAEHVASDFMYRGTIGANSQIAISAIAASVPNATSRVKSMTIASIEYKSAQRHSMILDWRSPRFILALKHDHWIVRARSIPFVLRPEDAPIAYVQLRSNDDAMLYPSSAGEDPNDVPGVLVIGLRSSAACPKQSAMHIDVDVDDKRITRKARAGQEVTLAVSGKIRSLSARGASNRCRVAQQLSAGTASRLEITALDVP